MIKLKQNVSLAIGCIMFIAAFPTVPYARESAMEIIDMQVDHMTNPLGIDSEKPLFSWVISDESTRGQKQTAYRIRVADSNDNLSSGNCIWDSGKVSSDNTIDVEYMGQELEASARYYWNVLVWDKDGISVSSDTAYFETGLMDSGWSGAQWIGRSDTKKDGYFDFSDFTLDFDVKIVADAASVIFGADNEKDAYMWQISNFASAGAGTRLRPHKCTNGKWTSLANVQISESTEYAADYTHMTVAVKDGNAVTSVGGAVVNTLSLGSFKMGYLGFRKQANEKFAVDNIVLKDVGGNVVYTEDFEDGTADGFTGVSVTDGYADFTGSTTLGVLLRYGNDIAESAPMLRREFTTQPGKEVANARLYATAAGIYDIYINGGKTTDSYLNPGRTNYDDTIMYQTFDVTELINSGKNAIGAYLGHGWLNGAANNYGSTLYLYAKLLITYADGTTDTVVTDDSWRFYRNGPIIDDDMFNGFKYDATVEARLDGWTEPYFDDSEWEDVSVAAANEVIKNGSIPEIVAQNMPLIKNTVTLPAITVTEPEEGVYIYDFGQNIAGVARITASAPAGTRMVLRHAEILNRENMKGATGIPGTLNTKTLGNADNIDEYIFRGDKESESFEPFMTYHGFRYLEITGLSEPVPLENVKALLLMSDLPQTSSFESSNNMVNRLFLNSLWSARDNFLSIPTDCPQRNERAGWTGDAQIFARTAAYMMDVNAFYQKYCRDLRDASKDNRIVTDVAPALRAGAYQYGKSAQNRFEATNGWGDAIIIIPYQIYKQYGNKKVLEENYETMCNWIDYLVQTSTDYIRDQSWTGDWLPVNETKTPIDVTDTAFCAYSASLLAEMAEALGKTEDAEEYRGIYNNYRNAWRSSFLAADGCTTLCNTQTSYVLGLKFGLFDESERAGAAENLVKNIKSWDWHLTTGFLGLSYLNPVLSENGYSDVAYRLLEQEEYPSWLYSVKTGSTTIWESWYAYRVYNNGESEINGNSLNHFSYGAVSEWLYRYVLGIERDDANSDSFRHFFLKPQIGGSFTYAKGSYQSIRGNIKSDWQINKETGELNYDVTVPANTTATLFLPAAAYDTPVLESGVPASNAEGISFAGYEDGNMVYELESGSYSFNTTADPYMNAITCVKVNNKQEIDSILTVDGSEFTSFPANIIRSKSKLNIDMVSKDTQYVFRNFADGNGNVIANDTEVSGDIDVNAVFAYTGTDDGESGKKTVNIDGSSEIKISVNGAETCLPYTGQFDKGADVEIKVLFVPYGYVFSGTDDISCLSDSIYLKPKCDMDITLNISMERYKKGYDVFFDFESDLEGWKAGNGTVEMSSEADYMNLKALLKSNGKYGPRIYYNLYGELSSATNGQYLPAEQYDTIEIAFRASEIAANSRPVMYISTEELPIYTQPARPLRARGDVTTSMADGQLHKIIFDVGAWNEWTGNIRDIYIDVAGNAYVDLAVDYIKINYKTPTLTIKNTATDEEVDYAYYPGTVVDLTQFSVDDGFLGYSLQAGSTDYITALTIKTDTTIYANYKIVKDIVWDFEDNTSMGWKEMKASSLDTSGGSLKEIYSSEAGQEDVWAFIEGQSIPASDYKYIVLEMRHNIPDSAFGAKPLEVFFKTDSITSWKQGYSVNTAQLPASAGYKKYVIDLSSCKYWSGTINSLRIDAFETTSSENEDYWVEFDSISLCSSLKENNIIYSLNSFEELESPWGNANCSKVSGTDGYEDTAIAAKLSGTAANVFLYKPWDVTKFGDDKYAVYQVDVKFGSNAKSFCMATNGNVRITSNIDKSNPKLKQNDWNTITVVSEADGGKTKVYINGIYDFSCTSNVTRDNYNSSYNCIRFLSYAADADDTENTVVSYDNALVYTSNYYPEVEDEILVGSLDGENGATYTANCNYGVLTVAAYAGDVIVEVKNINLSDKKNTIVMNTPGAEYYKGYLWHDMIGMRPMCDSCIVENN